MTNGGGLPEPKKAEDINKRLGLHSDSDDLFDGQKLLEEHMLLCHTPLRDPLLKQKYQDKHVIVTGTYEELDVALFYGYHGAIHVEELALFYPD